MNMKILPADNYKVVNKSIITDNDLKILNMLYLPLIGALPIMLYNTLVNDLNKQDVISGDLEHAHLLSNLHATSEELVSARNMLEGIGLIKTYFKDETIRKYIYELYSPVSAHEFFSHPVFNVIIYNNVGKKEYERLFEYFKVPKVSKEGYVEVTHTFNQVFKSMPADYNVMYKDNVRKYNKLKLNINTSFDINLLIETMPKQFDKKLFTKDLQELIILLAYLYDIDVFKMQDIIKTCVNEKGMISRDELRKVCRDYYQIDHNGMLPTMTLLTQPSYLRKPIGDNSKLAKMIYTFETVSPLDFLKSKHDDGEVVKRDIKLLEDLLIDYKLKPGVVNVLIDYVLRTNDNKLSRNLIETIAGQWARKHIETVEEAIDIAKKNYNSKTSRVKDNLKEIKKPVWFDENVEIDQASDSEMAEMEDLLKEFR